MSSIAKCLLVLAASCCWASAAHAKPQVTLELLTRPGLPLTASQEWHRALSGLGVASLQIRPAGTRDEMGISQQGSKSAPSYKVIGIISSDNVLHVPGGNFKPGDTAKLRKWLENLSDEGAEGVTAARSAFGMIPRQLEQVQDDLKRPVDFSTKGMPTAKAVRKIATQLKFPLTIDEAAGLELAKVEVDDELTGLSSGTALALMLRPAGLVLVPERAAGAEFGYRIAKSQAGQEAWPAGWKPKKRPNEMLGELFEFLNVEIPQDIPVPEVLEAIQARLKVPFLFDHNALALHGIDPAKATANELNKRLTYSQVLNKVLTQARLKYELRVDEADKPFLWISTVKPAPQ